MKIISMKSISISAILVLLFISCGKKEPQTLSLSNLERGVDILL